MQTRKFDRNTHFIKSVNSIYKMNTGITLLFTLLINNYFFTDEYVHTLSTVGTVIILLYAEI